MTPTEIFIAIAITIVVVGLYSCWLVTRRDALQDLINEPIGTLRIDQSDPDEEPLLFLEIDAGQIGRLGKQKTVTLRVSHESYIRK